jgi:hypothetical protein
VPASWVAGDEVYGADPHLRRTMRQLGLGYVLQVSANRRVPTHAGPICVDELPALLTPRSWQKYSCGAGSTGHRYYSWAWIDLLADDADDAGCHHLLIRSNDRTGELAYLRCYSPLPVSLAALVRVAGQRRRVEENFQAAKGLTRLDQHQVQRWTSWHRTTTLAMLAVSAAIEREHTPAPVGLIELTVNEFRRLLDAILLAVGPSRARSPGPAGGDDTKAEPTIATTDDAKNNNDHELVGWPGGIAPPGSHRTERDSLPSLRSSHPPGGRTSRSQAQCRNSVGSRSRSPRHHRWKALKLCSRRYFCRAQRIR